MAGNEPNYHPAMSKEIKSLSLSAEEILAKKRQMREEHWYAVAVASQHERKIVETLKAKGKEAYVPVRQEKHRWSDRMKIVDIVLTPQIIFVRNSMDKKNEVFVNHNVKCYIYAPGDNRPCPITDERMRDFMRLIDKNYEFKLTVPVVGEDVMVLEGPLKGLVGELVKVEAEKQLFLRMNDAFGALVKIDAMKVQRVPKGTKSVASENTPRKVVQDFEKE